jgi:hypothetical protein
MHFGQTCGPDSADCQGWRPTHWKEVAADSDIALLFDAPRAPSGRILMARMARQKHEIDVFQHAKKGLKRSRNRSIYVATNV